MVYSTEAQVSSKSSSSNNSSTIRQLARIILVRKFSKKSKLIISARRRCLRTCLERATKTSRLKKIIASNNGTSLRRLEIMMVTYSLEIPHISQVQSQKNKRHSPPHPHQMVSTFLMTTIASQLMFPFSNKRVRTCLEMISSA